MDKLIPIEDLFDLIDEAPTEGWKEARKRGKGVRRLNWETGASAYALAKRLKKEPALLSGFYSQEFWDGGYEKDPAHILRHCCQFVNGAREGCEGKQADNWASAMQPTFDETMTTPEKLLEMLTKGGFKGLRGAAPQPSPRASTPPRASTLPTVEQRKQSGPEDDTEADGGLAGNHPESLPSQGSGEPPCQAHYPKMTMKQVFQRLLIDMELDELDQFLDPNSEVGDRRGIMVERQVDDPTNGRLVWRAVEIK